MKSIFLFCLFFNLSQVFAESKNAAPVVNQKTNTDTVVPVNEKAHQAQLKAVLVAHDQLFDSLLGKDQDQVEKAAAHLKKTIAFGQMTELKTLAAAKGLEEIKGSKSKDANIEAYSKFLPTLVEMVKKLNPAGYGIFYCPMIKKNWVQNTTKYPGVTNVLAQYMLECGEKAKL